MALVQEQIPNLINGVSQQPTTQRLASQCEEQINYLPSEAIGCVTRPPLEHVGVTAPWTDDNMFSHTINRDATERYKVMIASDQFDSSFSSDFTQGDLQIYRLSDGTQMTVSGFPSAYLGVANARDNIRALTVADYTFLLNRTYTTAMTSDTADTRAPEGIFFLKQATNATSHELYVDGVLVSNVAGDNNAATQINDMYADIVSVIGTGGTNEFKVEKIGRSNVWIQRYDGGDFTMHASAPEANLVAIKDSVAQFSDLPAHTKDGFTIRVAGDPGSTSDDYWIRYESAGIESQGEWLETLEPGIANKIDPLTMPVQLVRSLSNDPFDEAFSVDFGGSDFYIQEVEWADRLVGDDTTNPEPTFIGQAIKNLYFHKNRLAFLTGENLVLSEFGEYFNFWSTTATDLLDSDPIDVAAPSNNVADLNFAVPYDQGLLCFSAKEQFKLENSLNTGLTPESARFSHFTSYTNSDLADPFLIGKKIIFAEKPGTFGAVREFGFVQDLSDETADKLTAHIPSYLVGDITRMYSVPSENLIFVQTDNALNEIYVYKFLIDGGQKVLSSWGKWTLPANNAILDFEAVESDVYAVIKREDGTHLEKCNLQVGNLRDLAASDTSLTFKVCLDRLDTMTGSYDSGTDKTTFTLNFPEKSTVKIVKGPAFGSAKGSLVQGLTKVTDSTYTVTGDLSAGFVWYGVPYTCTYTFSELSIKTEKEGKTVSTAGGRLVLKRFNVGYYKTPYFKMKVDYEGKDSSTYVFTRIVGSIYNIIGEIPFESGDFDKVVMGDSRTVEISLIVDSYFPATFTDADWMGNYTQRASSN